MSQPAPEVPSLEASNRMTLWTIVAMALLIRLLLLFVRGDYIVYDEGYYLLLARSLRSGHGFSLNGLPHVALSPLQPLVVAVLSFTGLPDLWASRLLAAVCGALLPLPVAALAARCFGERGARTAALFTAVHPALLTFLPFFPGEGWNLYFGSEPLFLLLGLGAVVAALNASLREDWRWWAAFGALGALAYLTRLEGIVLSAALGLAALGTLAWRKRLVLLPRAAVALAVGVLIASPYLSYLHGALGRWALSGRVQAAAPQNPTAGTQSPSADSSGSTSPGGSDAVRDFVWGGNEQALWHTLYTLDASGTHMASQYWGVDRRTPSQAPGAPAGRDTATAPRPAGVAGPSMLATLTRSVLIVVPLWFLVLAAWGAARVRPAADLLQWAAPLAIAALLPALLAYAEPRAMLLLVPLSCILAAGACEQLRALFERRSARPERSVLLPASIALALAIPTVRAAILSWDQSTPLQRVSAARRVVGEYLEEHLPEQASIVSWHPAVALWAHRDWRVLPYEPIERILGYARAQQAGVVVFSRFDPSPFREPPRAFTAILVDRQAAGTGTSLRIQPVDTTATLFVGRIVPPDTGQRRP